MSMSDELFLGKYARKSPLLLFWNFSLLDLMDTYLSLHSHPFVMAMLLGLIPALLVGLLPAHLLWHLVTLLDWFLPAFLRWFFPAFSLRDIDANFMGDRHAPLFGYLLADSVAGTLLKWDMFAHFFSLEMLLVVCLLDVDGSNLDFLLQTSILQLLQSNLLGTKTNGKANTKSKFLANVPTYYCTKTSISEETLLPPATLCFSNFPFSIFNFNFFCIRHFNGFFFAAFIFIAHININPRVFAIIRPLPLLVLLLGLMVMVDFDLHVVAFFFLLHPAFRLIPTLLRVLGVALLFILGMALLMVGGLAEFFILGLALCAVLSLATGAIFGLAQVLELLYTYLFLMGLTVWRRDILPLNMALRFLQFLLKMIFYLGSLLLKMFPYLGKVPCADRH